MFHIRKFSVAIILVLTMFLASAAGAASLPDVADHWAEGEIRQLVGIGAITGYPDGTYKPEDTITRAEFSSVMWGALDFTEAEGAMFPDIEGHWGQGRIEALIQDGIIDTELYEQHYGPDDPITREEIAMMTVRMLDGGTGTTDIPFTDAGLVGTGFHEYVAEAYDQGIITGYPDNTFRPSGTATRAEAAIMAIRALRIADLVDIEEEATQTITNQTTGAIEEKLQTLTEEGNFQGVVNLLDTPERLIEYMSKNFLHYVDKYGKPLGYYDPYLPEDFFHARVGNCEDFSVFASYVLDQHGYEVYPLYTFGAFPETCPLYGDLYGHTVAVFHDEDGKLKLITNVAYNETGFIISGPFDTLEHLINREEERTGVRLYMHGITYHGSTGEQKEPRSFEKAVQQLRSPAMILNYVARNFQKTDRTPPAQSPQQLFQNKEGEIFDFKVFISYLLDRNGYETHMLCLKLSENGLSEYQDIKVIYLDKDGSLRSISSYGTHPNKVRMIVSQTHASLENLIKQVEEVRSLRTGSKVKANRYGFIVPGSTNLQPTEWLTFPSDDPDEAMAEFKAFQTELQAAIEAEDFEAVAGLLDTPEKAIEYVARNFQEKKDWESPHLSPQQLFQTKEGSSWDFAIFISDLLDRHGYNTQMLRFEVTVDGVVEGHDIIVTYWDNNDKLKFIFHGSDLIRESFMNYEDLIRYIEEVRSIGRESEIRVSRYGFLEPGTTDLQPNEWITFLSE